MKLVIAEKPSGAQSIAAVLGAGERREGYMEGNGYLVSWCVGHLVELAQADAYDERYAKWRYEDLPILPLPWRFTISMRHQRQFKVLRTLMADQKVDTIICATDAGREGELIFRLVYEQTGCRKPVLRLWISSMEDAAIRTGFARLRDAVDYDHLYQAALCRAQADWLVGINATRLFSVLHRQTLNVGRVMTPTLAMLVERESAIEAFITEPFFTVTLDGSGFIASGKRLMEKMTAEQIRNECTGKPATITSVEQQDKIEKPPKLYDLTTLQRDANRMLGYSAQQTLEYAQSLYEKKLITYPRTDSRYLTSDMAESASKIARTAADRLSFFTGIPFVSNILQVVDDSKVSDHHALLPTSMLTEADFSALPAGERETLTLIAVRLVCAIGDNHLYSETTIELKCSRHLFTAKGKTILQLGWKEADQAYQDTRKDRGEQGEERVEPNPLPPLQKGQVIKSIQACIKEGKTTPPKHFTEDTLLSAMETAAVNNLPEDAERKGLGTPATRAGILEKLIRTELVERKGDKKTKSLLPTNKGVKLITLLPEYIRSPKMTAEWEDRLKQIEKGKLAPDIFIADISKYTADLVNSYKSEAATPVEIPTNPEPVGNCPRCGQPVLEGDRRFFCSNTECRFALWKDTRFFQDKKKTLTRPIAASLLHEGKVKMKGLYSAKTGKTYDAEVVLDDTDDKYVNFRLEFEPNNSKAPEDRRTNS